MEVGHDPQSDHFDKTLAKYFAKVSSICAVNLVAWIAVSIRKNLIGIRCRQVTTYGGKWCRRSIMSGYKGMTHGLGIRAIVDKSGMSAVEFALLAPVLFLILLGIFVFGVAVNDYTTVTNAAGAGTFQLAVSRGGTTPYTDTVSAVKSAAPSLTVANLTIKLTVNGTVCTTDTGCVTALSTASGKTASVQVSYPCNLIVMDTNYKSGCTLTASSTGRVQ
jgi:Flp pilus assembly protein TadG